MAVYYYKDENGHPIKKNANVDQEGLTQITEDEYNALVREGICGQIALLQYELKKTDYVVLKIAEARTQEEKDVLYELYDDVIAHRVEVREQINQLQGELE